jgi:hypothetical protein
VTAALVFRPAASGFLIKGKVHRMLWFLAFPVIGALTAVFMRRFERHLNQLTGPWILY